MPASEIMGPGSDSLITMNKMTLKTESANILRKDLREHLFVRV
jgi:hypothetical protein